MTATDWPTQEQEDLDRRLYEKCVKEQQAELRKLKEQYFARKAVLGKGISYGYNRPTNARPDGL